MTRLKYRPINRHGYDIVVVGGRCAGSATAMLLARAGLHVALVERATTESDRMPTHALMRAGVIQLHRWGLLERVIAAGTPAVRQTVFRYGAASTTVSLKRLAGVDALYAPQRSVLDPILQAAAGEAGADLLLGVSVTDVVRAADGRVIGVVGHDDHGEPVRVAGALTIGADGLHSTVARAVGASVERRASNVSSSIYAHIAGLETAGYEWLYSIGVSAALIPTNDGQTLRLGRRVPRRFHTEMAAGTPSAFLRLLAEASPELARSVAGTGALLQLRSLPGELGFMRRPWGPGWALVGDAGYYKDPISAHGTSDALLDAQLLADASAAFLTGEATEEEAMIGYHRTRNRLSSRVFTVTDAIASYEWDTRSVEAHLRSLNAAMVDEIDYLLASDTETKASRSTYERMAVASGPTARSEGQR